MSLLQDLTHISLSTSRASAIRMLNAVIINMGATELITGSDDRDAILKKIEAEEGGLFRISIPALLDADAMKDGQLRQKHEDYAARKEAGTVSDEEGYDDSCDDMTTDADMIDIVDVLPYGETCEIKFILYECEGCACYSDWCDWGDIVKVYGGSVLMDNDLYRNGRFEEFCGTTIWKEENGEVKEDRISPLLEVDKYLEDFDRLVRLDPDRYRQRYLDSLEENVRVLQRLIDLEKNNKAVDADIPEAITWLSRHYGNFNLRSIHLPVSRTDIKGVPLIPFINADVEALDILPDNALFSFKGNCLLDKEGRTLYVGFRGSVIPETVETISCNAFGQCVGLTSITIPANVKKIESNAFNSCEDLTEVVLPEGLLEIGDGAFCNCSSLRSITIPGSVSVIRTNTFRDCTSLTGIVIPEGVSSIGHMAFMGCTGLKEITLPGSVIDIKELAFEGCPCLVDLKERYYGLVRETPDEWIRTESEDRTAENDLIDGKGHAVIPEGTVEIEPEFFEDCKGLVSVEIPSTVRVIGYGAFFGCTGLTSVVIPESTVEIQECAFKGCTALSDVVIPEGTDISFDAFEGCPCEKDVEKRLG